VDLAVACDDLAGRPDEDGGVEEIGAVAFDQAAHEDVAAPLARLLPEGIHGGPVQGFAVGRIAVEGEKPAGPDLRQ
jgi:hypothetical protein